MLGSGTPQQREGGAGLGLQEKQGTTVGWGRGGGGDHRNLPTHARGISEGGAALVQVKGGEMPVAQAVGDQKLLVQATGGWTPLTWAKGSRGVC